MISARHLIPSVTLTRRPYLTGGGLVAFLALAHAATDAVTSAVGALLPGLQSRLALTEASLALLVAALTVGASLAQPLLGALADRVGRHLLAGLGVILTATVVSLVGIVSSAPLLLVLLLVGGLGSAAIHPAGASIARAALVARSGLAVSLFGAGGTVGVALGPLIVLALVAGAGPGATPWLMIPGLVLGTAALVFIPPSARRTADGTRVNLFDASLFIGPIGLLALTEVASSLAYLTFASTVPLWLVGVHGRAPDAPLIGWTLATFSLSAALGGIIAGLLAPRIGRRFLVGGTMLLAPLPLFGVLQAEPGSLTYFMAAGLGGGLANAGLPLKIVTAQELAPRAVATASGMLMGFAMGIAGLLYIGIGVLQETIGLVAAATLAYLALIPAAVLAFVVLGRRDVATTATVADPTEIALLGVQCPCSRGYTASAVSADVAANVQGPGFRGGPAHACAMPSISGAASCTCQATDGLDRQRRLRGRTTVAA